MPGAFSGLYMASNALRSFQLALNVTGNNLANINTRGYSRQTIDIQQTPDETAYGLRGQFRVGTGAYAQSVNRIRDIFLQGRYIQSNYEGGRLDQMLSTLRGVEDNFAEPSTNSISNAMSAMWDSWGQLNANPSDNAARLSVRLQAELFASRVQTTNGGLLGQKAALNQETVATINKINQLASQISNLNDEIRRATATGGASNTLMDQRDVALEDLSSLVNINTVTLRDNSVTVFVDNYSLVNQISSTPLPANYDPATSTVTNGTKITKITGGKLAGLLNGINAVDTYKSQLDTMVNEVRTQINALHVTGINPNATTGINIFSGNAGAGDLAVDPAIQSDLNNIAAGVSGLPGDGGLARAIAGLRDTNMAALGNQSPTVYYNNLVAQIGQDTSYYANAQSTQQAVLTQLDEQRQSVSGVNSDEELGNMLRYQRSFQAASKILSVLDQTTDELIRSFGR